MIEITASFTGTISTGEFENEKPLFSLKETSDLEKTELIEARQQQLYNVCRGLFNQAQQESIIKKIENLRKDLRFYDGYPSVTSITGWDSDFYVSADDLIQYASRGSILHKLCEIYAKEKVWRNPKDVPECYPDLVILKKGSLQLTWDDVDFVGFLEKYPIEFINTETVVRNDEYKYAGRYDAKGKYEKKVTLIDYKSGTVDEVKCMKQLTAYWHTPENTDVEQVIIVHLNNKTKQGFSKPIICNDKEKYWSLFLQDRENLKKRFQI